MAEIHGKPKMAAMAIIERKLKKQCNNKMMQFVMVELTNLPTYQF